MAVQLNFREKGIPKEIRQKILILLAVFFCALLFFQILLNRGENDTKVTMASPTLPLVSIQTNGRTMGQLHGYVSEMDACYMRDALIPLDSDRTMELTIDTYGYDVDTVSYEVRSLDTERKIADTTLTDWDVSGDTMSRSIQIENLVEEGEEYLLVLTIDGDGKEITYYTRIMLPAESYAQSCLSFADEFHDTAMSDSYEDLAAYVETSDYTDKDDLGAVGIDSSIDQIGWQGFDGTQVGEPLVTFTDINDTYASLVYTYEMQRESGGQTIYYLVEEYFKLRYTQQQTYLLDYQREMEQILDASVATVSENVLEVGVTSGDAEYLSNETGTIVSFVQAGELFSYDQNKQQFTKVYGFIDTPTEVRESYQQHDICILNIDETGNMDFVVYGYMNRGEHEGECGIDLYYYDSNSGEAIEQVFIATSHSYPILNADFSDLLYENTDGDFYIMLGGTLAKVGLEELTTKQLIGELNSDQYAVSSSGRYVAWISEGEMAQEIQVMDLETEEIRTITAEDGTLLRPLSFMSEDLVYGVAAEADVATDAAGSVVYPMATLCIVETSSDDFKLLKEYAKSGTYVTGVTKEGYTLYLDRVTKSDGTYVACEQDTIKDTEGEQNKTVSFTKTANATIGLQSTYVMAELTDDVRINSVSNQTAGLAKTSTARNITVSTEDQQETYFVYVGNRVSMTTQNLTKAIAAADADMGIVVDNKQRYIWKRGKKTYVNAFTDVEVGVSDADASTSAGCISAMLAREDVTAEVHALLERGETPMSVLERMLPDALVLDLTDCTLSEVLYYVSQDTSVYARTAEDAALLIIGYDASNIIVYHSDTDTYAKIAMDTATEMFESAGNVFISYVE